MLPRVYTLLRASPAVVALVDKRIYRHGSAPQDVQGPYVTWFIVTGIPENVLDGTPCTDRYEVQVDCWSHNTGTGDLGIETLAKAVRDAIETTYHVTAISADTRDPETQRYRISMTATFWTERE